MRKILTTLLIASILVLTSCTVNVHKYDARTVEIIQFAEQMWEEDMDPALPEDRKESGKAFFKEALGYEQSKEKDDGTTED